MLPVIALVGRPNVGKSTLFNVLTRTRDAIVADFPGLTRDRQYGMGKVGPCPYVVIDTGGLTEDSEGVEIQMQSQVMQALDEADYVLFLVDAQAGLSASDQVIANQLRRIDKPVFLIVNKTDGSNPDVVTGDFYQLGLGDPIPIAAAHRRGVNELMNHVLESVEYEEAEEAAEESGIRIAIIGRPNVGKSTLVNRILGEERVVTFDMPGTTRDSIAIPFERNGERFTLIDTAGVRRKSRVSEAIEKFSAIKTLQAIEQANVIVMVLDAQEEIAEQDKTILSYVLDSGRALVVAVNKWDHLEVSQKEEIKRQLDRKLSFLSFADIHFISAKHGTGVGDVFDSVKAAYRSAMKEFSTSELTRILEDAVAVHPPPIVKGRRIKLRYAHTGGHNPPRIIVHGSQAESVPPAYERYLANKYREVLRLRGTPVFVHFKSGENPYKDRKNKLTDRQVKKRRRLMKHVKGKK